MKKTRIIILVCIISILSIYGIFSLAIFDTSAKYTNYKEMNHYYESNKIYISSESLLDVEGKYNIINYYNYEPITINVSNSISENQITNYDIDYEIQCTVMGDASNYYTCLFDEEEGSTLGSLEKDGKCVEDELLSYEECIDEDYTYKLNTVINSHDFKINKLKQNNYEKLEVEVKLTTTSPFSKTLQAIYVLNLGNNNKNTIYVDKVKDFDSYCEYTISNNYTSDKTIQISVDTGKLLFDSIDKVISYTNNSDGIIDSVTIEIKKQEYKNIKLYKNNFDLECSKDNLNYTIIN